MFAGRRRLVLRIRGYLARKEKMVEESRDSLSGGRPPRLLEQVAAVIRQKYYSRRTGQAYAHWIKRYIWFHGRKHPRDMGAAEVTAFLNHLASDRNVAAGTQN